MLFIRNYPSVFKLWKVCSSNGGAAGGFELVSIAAAWWALWLERNIWIFEHKNRPLNLVLADARSFRSLSGRCCV